MANQPSKPSGSGSNQAVAPDAKQSWTERAGAAITKAGKTSLVVISIAGVVVILYWISASILPRWWSQVVGNQVDGSISAGIGWGLFYGFLFSFIPVLVISLAAHSVFKGWKAKLIVVLIGMLLALPNWLTLWVVLGTNSAAHAGQRTMDVDAPFFRAWSAVGVVAGVVLGLFIVIGLQVIKRRRARNKEREAALTEREQQLKAQQADLDAKVQTTPPPPAATNDGDQQ